MRITPRAEDESLALRGRLLRKDANRSSMRLTSRAQSHGANSNVTFATLEQGLTGLAKDAVPHDIVVAISLTATRLNGEASLNNQSDSTTQANRA